MINVVELQRLHEDMDFGTLLPLAEGTRMFWPINDCFRLAEACRDQLQRMPAIRP